MWLSDETWKMILPGITAILGAAAGALVKGFLDKRASEKKQLTIWKTKPTNLIMVPGHVNTRVEIRVDGSKVSSLNSTELQIVNTGNRALNEVHIDLLIEGKKDDVVGVELMQLPTGLANVNISEKNSHDSRINYFLKLPFLNPGEAVLVRMLSSGDSVVLTPSFRQPDVTFSIRDTKGNYLETPMVYAMFEIIRRNFLLHAYFKVLFPPYRKYLESSEKTKS